MAKINTNQIDTGGDNLMHSIITERIKSETKLFINLAMCEAQLKAFADDFTHHCLTGHALMEWTDRIEKLNKAKAIIQELIKSKTKEWMLEKKT